MGYSNNKSIAMQTQIGNILRELPWTKEARHKSIQTVCFHLYKIVKFAKIIYNDKIRSLVAWNRRLSMEKTTKVHKNNFWDMQIYIFIGSVTWIYSFIKIQIVQLKCVSFIVCKSYFYRVDKNKLHGQRILRRFGLRRFSFIFLPIPSIQSKKEVTFSAGRSHKETEKK